MAQTVFFSATMQKSPASLPAQIMTEQGLDRVVYFVLRGGTDEQRTCLSEMLREVLIERVPLRRARREMWLCHYKCGCSELEHYDNYDALLKHVFGEKCRIRVRLAWREEV